ncbi:TetR family transcriptional regulator [Granulicoccus sp. GXG6511]|uniref:TetR family transcriptional regulator n=1 Tax=Granulicoccus sp. GXG6511 TaxID=3381351 RepID=UPI003D7E11B1
MGSASDDLRSAARIRRAALELFGEHGVDRTTVRQIAARADVSAGLVIHHFGSKDGLRQAVDDWILARANEDKGWFRTGVMPQPSDALPDPESAAMTRYLVQVLRHDGPAAARIFDRLCEFTEEMYAQGIAAGLVREPGDRAAAVATLVAYSMGASILGRHIARHLGGDELMEPAVFPRYAEAALELFTDGFFRDRTFLNAMTATNPARNENDQPSDRDH